jgi:hypothetical protein
MFNNTHLMLIYKFFKMSARGLTDDGRVIWYLNIDRGLSYH